MEKNDDKYKEYADTPANEDLVGSENASTSNYWKDKSGLYKKSKKGDFRVSNFYLEIRSEKIKMDESNIIERYLDLAIHINGEKIIFTITVDDFSRIKLMNRVYDAVGSDPILYGSIKDLRIGTQELSPSDIPTKTISTSIGLTPEKNFLYPGMLITPEGINQAPDIEVDLNAGSMSRRIGFLSPDLAKLSDLVKHLLDDFLALKSHLTMYPVIGHIVLSPFSSWVVSESGKQKPALHLLGPSGGGKSFLLILSASFAGQFDDSIFSWCSTTNSIEVEGFNFRDTIFPLDDYKAGIISQDKVTRVIQNHANNQGRARLNSKLEMLNAPYVRGLLLSTGEDFVSNVESVSGRTILIEVDPAQNLTAGKNCMRWRNQYRMFLPALIQWVISDSHWKENFKRFIIERTGDFHKETSGISNGLRIASNWALNALGFDLFVRFIRKLQFINDEDARAMLTEYNQILRDHLAEHASKLQSHNPVEAFFSIIGQKIAASTVVIADLTGESSTRAHGKLIGKLKKDSNLVCVFPDIAMEHLVKHYRAIGQKASFSKESLKDSLVREGLIIRPASGRLTTQVRFSGNRLQAWQFNADEFKVRCGLLPELPLKT